MPATLPGRVPEFLYGTAWKEGRTAALTELALRAGFRGIDTANQRRHYVEAAVGQALAAAYRAGVVTREELFLQTKFTYRAGQDHRLPYDPAAPIATQVAQSMASSLEHLSTDHIDSYVLHGPASGHGCCGGDAATKSQSKIVNPSDLAALGHTKPPKAAESCCCGGAGKINHPTDPKRCSVGSV